MITHNSDIVDLEEVADRLSITTDMLRNMIADGEFPNPIQFESGAVGWLGHVVDEWIINRPRVTDLSELRRFLKD